MTQLKWLVIQITKLIVFCVFQVTVHAIAFYFISPEVCSDYVMQIFFEPPK